jgi:hypothetical protein
MDDFSQPGLSNYYCYAPSPANFIKPCKKKIFSKEINNKNKIYF